MEKELLTLRSGESINYFCTWMTQNRVGEEINQLRLKDPAFTGDQGSRSAREQMNERNGHKRLIVYRGYLSIGTYFFPQFFTKHNEHKHE